MVEIIPAIIAQNAYEIDQKIIQVEPYVDWVQLDVMDGSFVKNSTWSNFSDLRRLQTRLQLEIHLMVQDPEVFIEKCFDVGVSRIVFHWSAVDNHKEIIDKIHSAGINAGIAINPEISLDELDSSLIKEIDVLLIMGVIPGRSGQKFQENTIDKIKQAKEKFNAIKVAVDGGVNFDNANQIIQAGADILVSSSTIFQSKNIKQAIQKLKSNDLETDAKKI